MGGGPSFQYTTPGFQIRDVDDGVAPGTCIVPDGIVVAPDDSYITAFYTNPLSGRVLRATTRVICRNLDLVSVELVGDCNGNDVLNLEETALLHIGLVNTTSRTITNLTGMLNPFDEDIRVQLVAGLPACQGARSRSVLADACARRDAA